MSGALMAMATAGGESGYADGITVSPAPAWSSAYGVDTASTNTVTIEGTTAPISVSVTVSAACGLYYQLNGSFTLYTGAFTVPPSAALGWTVVNNGSARMNGTVTVINVTDANTTLAAFSFSVPSSEDLKS